jgi:hypothetical protein
MSSRYAIDSALITPVLTSCGRFDLLGETIRSFTEHFAVARILVSEDSCAEAAAAEFAAATPVADMRVHSEKLGQMRSIDGLYAEVTTPYILHLEDDWLFSDSIDLANVTSFLEARPDISVVCIGYRLDQRFVAHARPAVHAGMTYLVWDLAAHPKWFSYSFNPSIARHSFWREFGPFERFATEENLSRFCKDSGLRIAMAVPGIAAHIGDGRHTPDPYQPKRATTVVGRLKRSIAKRWPLAAARNG